MLVSSEQLHNEQRLHLLDVMKASVQNGSDVPKIIPNNTVGHKTRGWEEQTQAIKDKDEGTQIYRDKK